MKQQLFFITLTGYFLTGCSWNADVTPPTPLYQASESTKLEIYNDTMKKLARSTAADPKYHRISLETAKNKAWFGELSYKLWNREITKAEFITEGVKKYPERQYEFEFISEGLNLQR